MKLKINNHIINITDKNIECIKQKSHHFELNNYRGGVELFFNNSKNNLTSIMHCKRTNTNGNSLELRHLSIPMDFRGQGIVKVCLAVMSINLINCDYDSSMIKFGRDSESMNFLKRFNFPDLSYHQIHNPVFIGGMVFHEGDEWKIQPIPMSYFPTGFYTVL